jgi:hypothetical protein
MNSQILERMTRPSKNYLTEWIICQMICGASLKKEKMKLWKSIREYAKVDGFSMR